MTRSIETARPAGDSDRHTAVRRLLAPCGVEEFVRDHWEARPLVIRRGAPDYYADLITLTQFEDLLDTRPDIATGIRILREGREAPIERLSKLCTTPSLERIYAHYREGATLSLTHLHKHWNPLADLCRDLGEVFSIGCQTNSYLTPRASRGLTGHFDTHDVLVLQVAGSKRWRIGGNPVPLPLPHQTSAGVRNPLYDQEFDLDAGDLLYLPRGYLHEAEALDGVSFHLTIGLLPLTYAELLAAEVEKVLEGDVAFRRGLPVGFHRDPDARRHGVATIEGLLRRLRAQVDPESVLANASASFTVSRPEQLRNHISDLEAADALDAGVAVVRRPSLRYAVDVTTEDVRIMFHGKVIRLPLRCAAVVDHLVLGHPVCAADLPGELDQASTLVVVRKLLREGFLTLAQA